MENMIVIVVVLILAAIFIPIIMIGAKNMSVQIDQKDRGNDDIKKKLSDELINQGFNIDKTVYIQNPKNLWNMQKRWIPCVNVFLFVDDKNKKWAISQNGDLTPTIYNYTDFREFEYDVDGEGSGNVGGNAAVGYLIGGAIGAVAGAALTKQNATITTITATIRVNSLQNPVITVPLFTGHQNGYRANASGFVDIFDLAARMEQTFAYINDNKYSTANT